VSAARTMGANAVIWLAICVAAGWAGGRLPRRWIASDTTLTRIREFERRGRIYQRLRVRRWKHRLPESNSLGPVSRPTKRTLTGRSAVPTYVAETRRAEYVHWAIMAAGPIFFVWSPTWVARTMTLFGIAFNLPFIAVQRFNRSRVVRSASGGRDGGVSP
jgi:glycosyl-4,4'-diaponeurosporenoate acyltransferase